MLIRSTVLYAPSVILPRLSSFLLLILLTHHLPVGEFGLYALVIAIGETIDMGFSGWIRFSLLRLDIAQPQSWRKALAVSYVLFAGSTALAIAVSIGVAALIAPERWSGFSLALSAYVGATALQRIGLTSLQMREKFTTFSAVESCRAVLQFVLVWTIVHTGPVNFCAASLGASAATLACGAAAIAFSLSRLPPGTDEPATDYWQRLRYGASLIVLSLTAYFVLSLDRILLKILSGAAAVGLYSAAYTLGRQPIDVISNSVSQGAFPELIKRHDTNGLGDTRSFVAGMLNLTNQLLLGAFGMLLGLGSPLVTTFLPPAYHAEAVWVLPIVALAFIAQNLKIAIFDSIFNLKKNNLIQIATYIPVIAICLLLSRLLIPRWDATGAAIALLAGMLAGLAVSIVLSGRIMAIAIDWRELAKAAFAAIAAGITAAVAAHLAEYAHPSIQLILGAAAGSAAWTAAVVFTQPRCLAPLLARVLPQRPGRRGGTTIRS